ncbi:MAG: response regulator transcription factor [Sphaerochaetaceae bacterium]
MKLIYIVEDHEAIAHGVAQYLKIAGYDAQTFPTLASVKKSLDTAIPDLIIQDVMLPDGDGFEFIHELKKTKSMPVIFMTAKITESDRITGFELGADDYITKPFSPRELVLRVQALFRRIDAAGKTPITPEKTFWANESKMEYDPHKHRVEVNGKQVYFTAAEWRIMEALVEGSPNLVTRASILEKCFDYSFESYERIVDTHIKNIRAKLGSENPWIETVRGYGYKFIGYTKA